MDIRDENSMYEYLKELTEEERMKVVLEINDTLDMVGVSDLSFLESFAKALDRINEDMKYRDEIYFRLYYLIDDDNNLTKLGEYYSLIFSHHYIKAIKLYMSFSNAIREKENVFRKNDKAMEYLEHFRKYILEEDSKIIKKRWLDGKS